MNNKNNTLEGSEKYHKEPYFDGYRPSYYFNTKGQEPINFKKDLYTHSFKNKFSEELNKVINVKYGNNTMSFNKNGDIKINDRLLTNDEEIVNALRKLLNLK